MASNVISPKVFQRSHEYLHEDIRAPDENEKQSVRKLLYWVISPAAGFYKERLKFKPVNDPYYNQVLKQLEFQLRTEHFAGLEDQELELRIDQVGITIELLRHVFDIGRAVHSVGNPSITEVPVVIAGVILSLLNEDEISEPDYSTVLKFYEKAFCVDIEYDTISGKLYNIHNVAIAPNKLDKKSLDVAERVAPKFQKMLDRDTAVEAIRIVLEESGLSQRKFAEKHGIGLGGLTSILGGKASIDQTNKLLQKAGYGLKSRLVKLSPPDLE